MNSTVSVETKIKDMRVGDSGWATPWSLNFTANRLPFLAADHTISPDRPEERGTSTMFVWRNNLGYYANTVACRYKWTYDGDGWFDIPLYSLNGDIQLPLNEDRARFLHHVLATRQSWIEFGLRLFDMHAYYMGMAYAEKLDPHLLAIAHVLRPGNSFFWRTERPGYRLSVTNLNYAVAHLPAYTAEVLASLHREGLATDDFDDRVKQYLKEFPSVPAAPTAGYCAWVEKSADEKLPGYFLWHQDKTWDESFMASSYLFRSRSAATTEARVCADLWGDNVHSDHSDKLPEWVARSPGNIIFYAASTEPIKKE